MPNQQAQVYEAQTILGPGLVFPSLINADQYLAGVLAMEWWPQRFPRVKDVEIHARRAGKFAGVATWYEDTWTGHIELAPSGRTERTLIHELAHVCAEAEYGHKAHGPAFVGVFLELVFRLMGTEAWIALRNSMTANGVAW